MKTLVSSLLVVVGVASGFHANTFYRPRIHNPFAGGLFAGGMAHYPPTRMQMFHPLSRNYDVYNPMMVLKM